MEGNDRCANILSIVRMLELRIIAEDIEDADCRFCNVKLFAKPTVFCFTAMPAGELASRRCLLVV